MFLPSSTVKPAKSSDGNTTLQAYIHQHVWLLFDSLALNMAAILYQQATRGGIDAEYVGQATLLHNSCIELINANLMYKVNPDEGELAPTSCTGTRSIPTRVS